MAMMVTRWRWMMMAIEWWWCQDWRGYIWWRLWTRDKRYAEMWTIADDDNKRRGSWIVNENKDGDDCMWWCISMPMMVAMMMMAMMMLVIMTAAMDIDEWVITDKDDGVMVDDGDCDRNVSSQSVPLQKWASAFRVFKDVNTFHASYRCQHKFWCSNLCSLWCHLLMLNVDSKNMNQSC